MDSQLISAEPFYAVPKPGELEEKNGQAAVKDCH